MCVYVCVYECIYYENLKMIIEGKEYDIKKVGCWTWVIEWM